jgi:DNA-binding NarL/FixJ family response regulator
MVTVLVVGHPALMRAGLVALIQATPGLDLVGEAEDGEQAVRLAAASSPDVILMDIHLPGLNGFAVTEQILAAAADPAPRILILTVSDLDEDVDAGLRAGASGFLLMDTPPQRLLAAIHNVAAGEMLFAPSITRRLVDAYVARSRRPPGQVPELTALTAREREVLGLVATGMSNTMIATRLVINENTVKTHLSRTMVKLGLASRSQAVVLAYETGLVTPVSRS